MKNRFGKNRTISPLPIVPEDSTTNVSPEAVSDSVPLTSTKHLTSPISSEVGNAVPFYERDIPSRATHSVEKIDSMKTITPPPSGSKTAVAEFDALRREATKLERHLEDRVARYQQLAQRLHANSNTHSHFSRHNTPTSRPSSLLDAAETGTLSSTTSHSPTEEESTLSTDISRTISAMSDLVNTRMAPAAERTGRNQHTLMVKRYREILFDCTSDYEKTRAAVARKRETAELFAGADTSGQGGEGEVDHLLRERNAIGNSLKGVGGVLGQAEEIRADLKSQGAALRGVSAKILTIAGNVPGVNKLIDSIQKKRNRDDMVVSGVIASCILFTLWYIFIA